MRPTTILVALAMAGCKHNVAPVEPEAPIPSIAGHGATVDVVTEAPAMALTAPSVIDPKGASFQLTYYWIALRPKNDPDEVSIKDCKGNVLTMASKKWLRAATTEATARFIDAEGEAHTINIAGPSCWTDLTSCESRWGLGVWDTAANASYNLRPFRSIAIDRKVLTMGAWYYIPKLDGVTLPSPSAGEKHDGCVRAVDVGGAIVGKHIDFFSAYESAYRALQAGALKGVDSVTIESGQTLCKAHIDRGY